MQEEKGKKKKKVEDRVTMTALVNSTEPDDPPELHVHVRRHNNGLVLKTYD